MDIIDLYKSILACGGMKADAEGFISLHLDREHPMPVEIGGKRLVLPTDSQLKHGDSATTIRFHPLLESVHRGESEVGERLRESINMNLNMSLGYIAIALLTLATSPAEHILLKPDQTIFMSAVKEADEGTIDRLIKIAEQMALGDPQRAFVHIFVRKGATVKGKKHIRAGVVNFPLYEALRIIPEPREVNEVFGVKLRKIDREALTNLLEYMIPGIANPENFIAPSDSTVAPFLDSLMKATRNIGVHINEMVELFGERLPAGNEITFDFDWEHDFQDLTKIMGQIRMIPMQSGNEGKVPVKHHAGAVIEVPGSVQPSTVVSTALPSPPQQVARNATEETPTGVDHFGRPYADRKKPLITPPPQHITPPPPATHLLPHQTHQTHFQQPHHPVVGGGYPFAQHPQMHHNPEQVVRTAHGTDFRSLLAHNPALAAAAGMVPRPGFAMQTSQDTPRWANQGFGANTFNTSYNSGYGGGGGGSFSNV